MGADAGPRRVGSGGFPDLAHGDVNERVVAVRPGSWRRMRRMGERLHVAPSHVARQPSWGVTGQRWPADGGAGSGWVEHEKRVKTRYVSY